MTPNESAEDIAKLLGKLKKESNGIDEWVDHASQNLEIDYVKCISCGRERPETEMQKVFHKQHRGICKMCFRFEIER
jgi:hypothetical protein